jgi:hypothetical protein
VPELADRIAIDLCDEMLQGEDLPSPGPDRGTTSPCCWPAPPLRRPADPPKLLCGSSPDRTAGARTG